MGNVSDISGKERGSSVKLETDKVQCFPQVRKMWIALKVGDEETPVREKSGLTCTTWLPFGSMDIRTMPSTKALAMREICEK